MGNEVKVLTDLLPVLETITELGLPGLLLVLASIPAIVVVVVFILERNHGRQVDKVLAAYRQDTQDSLRVIAERFDATLREQGQKHQEVVDFYRKNISLVKNYERMNDTLQTLVVNNTRAVEHLSTIIEARDRV